jgi:hypothetical protein
MVRHSAGTSRTTQRTHVRQRYRCNAGSIERADDVYYSLRDASGANRNHLHDAAAYIMDNPGAQMICEQ